MSDPKLKAAMKEIKEITEKYDIAGSVILVSPTHSEFLLKLNASWSVVKIENEQLRFRSKEEDFKNEKEQNIKTNATVHLIHQIRDLSAYFFDNMEKTIVMLKKYMDINHTPYKGFEPHED